MTHAVHKFMNSKELQWIPLINDDVARVGRGARRETINYNCTPVVVQLPRYVAPRTEPTAESVVVTTVLPTIR